MNHVVLKNSLEMSNHYNSSFSREIIKYIHFVSRFYFLLALSRLVSFAAVIWVVTVG